MANALQQFGTLLLFERIAGQEVEQGHQAHQLQQAPQQGDLVDRPQGGTREPQGDPGQGRQGQEAGCGQQVGERLEAGGAQLLQQLVEKLQGQARVSP